MVLRDQGFTVYNTPRPPAPVQNLISPAATATVAAAGSIKRLAAAAAARQVARAVLLVLLKR